MELEKAQVYNPESNDEYRQRSPMNVKSLLKSCWGTLENWHDCSSLESFKMEQPAITCFTQKAYTEPHTKCSSPKMQHKDLKQTVADTFGAHTSSLWPLISRAALGNVPNSLYASLSFHENLQAEGKGSGKFERYFLSFPLKGTPFSIAGTLKTPPFSSFLTHSLYSLSPIFGSHSPNKLRAWALGFLLQALLSEKL